MGAIAPAGINQRSLGTRTAQETMSSPPGAVPFSARNGFAVVGGPTHVFVHAAGVRSSSPFVRLPSRDTISSGVSGLTTGINAAGQCPTGW